MGVSSRVIASARELRNEARVDVAVRDLLPVGDAGTPSGAIRRRARPSGDASAGGESA